MAAVIRSVLVANRGEIARRVFRTCRDRGISTVAVFSDADAGSPHVREADAAVLLPGNAPSQTYLRVDAVIEAALRADADAVHPGYGFLSENAGFARAVLEAGLCWIGPSPEAIDAMGSKIEAKRLMSAAGVPVLDELAPDEINASDLPVLIKASAGGGGRGMRVVRRFEDLQREVEAARAEAASAFGDDTVFCEPYLATGRHIEVQVMADQHGTVWAVGERECSIQRRHQKVVEEAPSPLVERIPGMRERLFEAARSAAKAIAYCGAGTVEFLADEDGRFFFLEMNTRLQVEHPVTECTTGLDLVALQLDVAEGAALAADPPPTSGASIEVRLYAEDPARDWQPQSGLVHRFAVPGVEARFGPSSRESGVRLDSSVADGSTVGIYYDPMLAKIISWAPARERAAALLSSAVRRMTLHGLVTNRDLLVNVLQHPAFLAGETTTAFFDQHGLDTLAAPVAGERALRASATAAALAGDAQSSASARVLVSVPSGWRNVFSQPQLVGFRDPGGQDIEVALRGTRAGVHVLDEGITAVSVADDTVVLDVDGIRRRFTVARYAEDVYVDSALGAVRLAVLDRFPDPADQVAAGSLLAPMPGSVVRIVVEIGDVVVAGQPLLWLEAMKMQHQIDAPLDGTVTELPISAGQQVDVGTVLAVVAPKEENA